MRPIHPRVLEARKRNQNMVIKNICDKHKDNTLNQLFQMMLTSQNDTLTLEIMDKFGQRLKELEQ